MSNKSQLNNLSKREILESLLARQQQDSSTVNRLVLALALAAGVSAEALAEKFADGTVSGEFAARFNKALDAEFAKRQQADVSADEAGEAPAQES
ncbi:MAG: hypothetical protein JNK33_03510 [Candidatus Doudnabacteria bacterium]|nr:hypothetical protein [Candidatus Doudnabacteria bacterium]